MDYFECKLRAIGYQQDGECYVYVLSSISPTMPSDNFIISQEKYLRKAKFKVGNTVQIDLPEVNLPPQEAGWGKVSDVYLNDNQYYYQVVINHPQTLLFSEDEISGARTDDEKEVGI